MLARTSLHGERGMTGRIDKRLTELGLDLPDAPAPVANYVPFVVTGNLVSISGQVTLGPTGLQYIGKLGRDFNVEEGQAAARLCAVNLLAQLRAACEGDLDRVRRCVRLGGFVNAMPDFDKIPHVINGASDLIVDVFGEAGRHSRAAVGVASLPANVAVEVDGLFEID